LLEDLASAQPERALLVANTHLDHQSPALRAEGMAAITRQLAALWTSAGGAVLCGDWNAVLSDASERALLAALPSALQVLQPLNGAIGSFTDWRPLSRHCALIDHVAISPITLQGSAQLIDAYDREAVQPSDHRALLADLQRLH
jgi:endonuclease/exonuclease/phosphatase family metal-dependent hydrolase